MSKFFQFRIIFKFFRMEIGEVLFVSKKAYPVKGNLIAAFP